MILIASHVQDDHAAAVSHLLTRAGHSVALVDTGAYPRALTMALTYAEGGRSYALRTPEGTVDLDDAGVVWWRRPQPYGLDDGLDPSAAGFAYSECHEAIEGMWRSLAVAWVNPPGADEAAHHKPLQLAIAGEVGLEIPDTLVTNDPIKARAFVELHGPENTVYKTFLASETHWRETRILRRNELPLLDSVRLAPVIFQTFVPADVDLRVTVVGDDLFATAIKPRLNGYTVDYRMDLDGAAFSATTLPEGVQAALRALLDRLGLVYGAIDMRLTPEGRYVFLEVNPSGEWRFVEDRTQQPISTAMADLLARLDRRDDA